MKFSTRESGIPKKVSFSSIFPELSLNTAVTSNMQPIGSGTVTEKLADISLIVGETTVTRRPSLSLTSTSSRHPCGNSPFRTTSPVAGSFLFQEYLDIFTSLIDSCTLTLNPAEPHPAVLPSTFTMRSRTYKPVGRTGSGIEYVFSAPSFSVTSFSKTLRFFSSLRDHDNTAESWNSGIAAILNATGPVFKSERSISAPWAITGATFTGSSRREAQRIERASIA